MSTAQKRSENAPDETAADNQPPSLASDLERIAKLKSDGALTDAEYAQAKALLLSPPTTAKQAQAVEPPPKRSASIRTESEAAQHSPAWMKPWGWVLTLGGSAAFIASFAAEKHFKAGLLSGLLNPLCLVGLPLGLYWLARSGVFSGNSWSIERSPAARQTQSLFHFYDPDGAFQLTPIAYLILFGVAFAVIAAIASNS